MKNKTQIIKNILTAVLVAFTFSIMVFTIVSVRTIDQNHRDFMGYKALIVYSDSMKATDFSAGDLIFVKETDPSTLKAGDIIAFISQDSDSFGQTITHKIRRKAVTTDGGYGFVTYGTTNNTDDAAMVTAPYIIGKYVGVLRNAGTFFHFFKTTRGYVVCILLPFMVLIGWQSAECWLLYKQYKKQLEEKAEAERQRMEEQRRQNRLLEQQLERLRNQLAQLEQSDAEETELEDGRAEEYENDDSTQNIELPIEETERL